MDGQEAIVFVIFDKQTGVCGFTWFIESHRTSFYIKSTFKPMQMTKISIHRPQSHWQTALSARLHEARRGPESD